MAHHSSKREIMFRIQAGYAMLLTLGIAAACGKDPVSIGRRDASGLSPDAAASASRSGNDDDHGAARIAMRDDCDPRDPAWTPTGGCLLERGNVTFAEFGGELSSPLSLSVVGHQAWRNDPTYLIVQPGRTVRVRNEGGRTHTYTEVAQFGGGKVPNPALNKGLVTAPECPGSKDVAPGASIEVTGLAVGNHRFQCCIHPWMRGMIKVKAGQQGDDR
jgi:plastocyanin